jgi:hypothetical protein
LRLLASPELGEPIAVLGRRENRRNEVAIQAALFTAGDVRHGSRVLFSAAGNAEELHRYVFGYGLFFRRHGPSFLGISPRGPVLRCESSIFQTFQSTDSSG